MTSTDSERRHLARELHDGVTQYVLAAGFALDVARSEAEALGHDGHEGFEASLQTATALTREACAELRRLIAELSDAAAAADELPQLPELVQREAARHRDDLTVLVEVDGRVAPLPDRGDHEVARLVGEALTNAARHAGATRVVVRLHYRAHELVVSVADDGGGDPADLVRRLRRGPSYDGRHRGLSSMAERAADLGGTLAFRRARPRGVRVELRVPLATPTSGGLERAAR